MKREVLIQFFSSRDKHLIPTDRKTAFQTNGEQLFENNLGFVEIFINRGYNTFSIIQQKINSSLQKGNYCFKFRYKFYKYNSSYLVHPVSIQFAFSKTDLKEYYKRRSFIIPEKLIKVSFKDTVNEYTFNAPWVQQCYSIYLNGDEQYLSIGSLANKSIFPRGGFYIDDVELYPTNNLDSCYCAPFNRDLRTLYHRNFPLNAVIKNDTMAFFTPSGNVGSGIISPDTKEMLHQIISFMQRNLSIEINFLVFDRFYQEKNNIVVSYSSALISSYLQFFGINKNRIKVESVKCEDSTGFYCNRFSEFEQIGFEFSDAQR